MKILQIIPYLSNGGAEMFCIDLCNELAKTDQVSLLLFTKLNDKNFDLNSIDPKVKLIELDKKKGFDLKFQWMLYKIIKKENPKVIHAHLSAILYLYLPILFLSRATVLFHTLHSMAKNEEKRKGLRLVRKIFYLVKLVRPITISIQAQISFYETYKKKSTLIFNGIKRKSESANRHIASVCIGELKKNEKTKVFLAVGRFVPAKNFISLVRVFKKLEDRNVVLIMIGDDNSAEKLLLNEVLKEKGSNTFLIGSKLNAEVIDFMRLADALCFSSVVEGMPISTIEAFSVGLPVISTPAGGQIDLIRTGYNGVLADDFSEPAILKSIELFLNYSDIDIAQIRQNCLDDFIAKYSIEISAKAHKDCYSRIS